MSDAMRRGLAVLIVGVLLGPSFFGLAAPELFHYAFRSSPPEPMQTTRW